MFNKDNINWEEFAKELLWDNIVFRKNDDSGYEQGDETGDIGHYRYMSAIGESFHPVTWKELALALGLFTDILTPDGHDCHKCPDEKDCIAYFKYDKDHERCNGWKGNFNN